MMNVTTIKESNIKLVVPYIDPISLKVFGIWTLDKINKMKIATDLEQSKKLAEFLPLESADMYYHPYPNDEDWYDIPNFGEADSKFNQLPCWSLAALLSVLPKGTRLLKSATDDIYHCDCPKCNIDEWFNSSVDAAFEMIIWLKENGKI